MSRLLKRQLRVVFDSEDCGGSYVEDKVTGEWWPIFEKDGVFVLPVWIEKFVSSLEARKGAAQSSCTLSYSKADKSEQVEKVNGTGFPGQPKRV